MKAIWKFPFEMEDVFTIEMPAFAEILTVQTQLGTPVIWAEVDTEQRVEKRKFEIFGTGQPITELKNAKRKYINTFQLSSGSLVFHLYEQLHWSKSIELV